MSKKQKFNSVVGYDAEKEFIRKAEDKDFDISAFGLHLLS